jgi:biopolymer transport protein ExbD
MKIRTSKFGGAGAESESAFRPQLTSLIDVMTILLVFLLKSFSVEGQLVTPSQNLQLPVSEQKTTPEVLPNIEITTTAVRAEGTRIVENSVILRQDSLMIPPLSRWIQDYMVHTADTTTRRIMLQTDRNVAFSIVKKVMATCSKNGFDKFDILVIEKG